MSTPIPAPYHIEKMTWEALKPFFIEHRPKLFTECFSLASNKTLSDVEQEKMAILAQNMGSPFTLNLGLFHNKKPIGWSFGWQKDRETYYMTNSAIVPQHRRKGLYSCLLQKTIEEVQAVGFQIIESRHTATNNPVIIPKLKCGFIISGMEISDVFGTLVHLRYYTNPVRRHLMDIRSGQAKPDVDLMKKLEI